MKKYMISALIMIGILVSISFVRIESIEIQGNKEEWNTAENIKAELFSDNFSRISVWNLFSDLIGVHRRATFVDSYDIEWRSPTSIVVHIHHKNIVGCIQYVSSYMYFDKNGVVVENSGRKLSGIPQVVGLDFAAVYLYEKLEMYDNVAFTEIMDIIRNLNSYNIEADQIKYTILSRKTKDELEKERMEEERIKTQQSEAKQSAETSESETTVLMTEEAREDRVMIEDTIIVHDHLVLEVGELTVNLGSTDQLSGKLSELRGMLENISQMRGIVHLEHYEGKDGNNYYTFERK